MEDDSMETEDFYNTQPPQGLTEKIPPSLRLVKQNHPYFSNSTGSLYTADSTISRPDDVKLTHCVAEFFRKTISPLQQYGFMSMSDPYEVFDERRHPLGNSSKIKIDPTFLFKVPESSVVEQFCSQIFHTGRMSPEALVLAIGYVSRILKKNTNFKVYPYNWRRVVLACFVLSSKVWEELAVWNVDFSPLATVDDLSNLEVKLLELLDYDVFMKASEYANVYFELRSQFNLSGTHFAELKPLDQTGAEKLELKSSAYVERKKRLVQSSDDLKSQFAHNYTHSAVLKY